MILKNYYKSELLKKLEKEVFDKNGFKLTFLEKEMNEGYTDEQLKNNQKLTLENSNINWDLSEAEFAKALKRICFNDKQVLFTGKEREADGYLFNGVYWTSLSLHNAELKKEHFDNLYKYYIKELEEIKNDIDEKIYNNLLGTIKSLNTHKTRTNVIKIFKDDNYVENVEWNKHINLFVFDDCIYNLEKGEFEEPKAENYINLSCGYNFNSDNFKKEDIQMVKNDILKIFKSIVKDDQYSYFMKTISSFLIQNNIEEKAYFWLGKGRNGKGTMTTILRNVFKKLG